MMTIWAVPDVLATSVSVDRTFYEKDDQIRITIFLDPEDFTLVDVFIQNEDREIVYQTQFYHDRNDGKYIVTTTAAFPEGLYSVIVETPNQQAQWDKLRILPEPNISVEIDKTQYNLNERIRISGIVSKTFPGISVMINVISSDGTILKTQSVEVQDDKTYSDSIFVDESIFDTFGTFKIRAVYEELQSEITFDVLEPTPEPEPEPEPTPEPESSDDTPDISESKIPEWVRNIFVWYGEGKIGEDDLISALQYLIQQGIIKI